MIKLKLSICLALIILAYPSVAFAAPNAEVAQFTSNTLNTLTIFASLVSAFFLIKGGYLYITSTGQPDALESAKKTIRNALVGLVLVLAANTFASLLTNAFTTPTVTSNTSVINLEPLEPAVPSEGLTQVLIDAIAAFLQNIVQSATKPITSALGSFLTNTPQVSTNSVIFNFWIVIVGIADSLFALMIALIGFQFMSSSTFGFEEVELKQILPRVGLAFLGANTSIFLIDWIIMAVNTLVKAVLNATGGLNQAWITNAFNPSTLSIETASLITLIFMIMFVLISVILLLFYITRLIVIALGAVMSPLIFLLWSVPKFADFAEISAKTYLTTIFSIFVHVVIIQLAASFLTVSEQVNTNPLISILVGVGLLLTLLKTQSIMMQLMFYNTGRSMIKKIGGQIVNVINAKQSENAASAIADKAIKLPRKVVRA
ncbi:MAG: hypothetical protein A2857_00340 [Candidatus Levybacteria bacterium RIFCSPHIGHO2_01_FULL_36_15]|nr:MAG: hypothetical protein A2857_00340 [Candidatus Levybacteria bacterium RIFCSPHIGHO2_01_FULL_36_15]